MIESPKPSRETLSNLEQNHLARLKRDDTLTNKIAKIITKHPNKSLNVIRRWLHNAET